MYAISLLLCMVIALSGHHAYADQSVIVDADGYACMGEDKSRKQTEQYAMTDAKRKAGELAVTYVQSETTVRNFTFEKDILAAYSNATIRIIQETEKGWYKDASMGDCYNVRIKAEVVPDSTASMQPAQAKAFMDNPSAPLYIHAWTDKKEYQKGESIKIYLQGNKPFYARVINADPGGGVVQLMPNPYRIDNSFNGTTVYEIPSKTDMFILEVASPYGDDTVMVLASTSQLGDIDLKPQGGVYEVRTKLEDIGVRTRGIKLRPIAGQKTPSVSEFYEASLRVKTTK